MPQTLNERTVRYWAKELDALSERIAPRFSRIEARRRVRTYLRGLLGSAERKNSWQLAEAAGESTPYGIQHLLGRAEWDADLVRHELRDYVVEHLGDEQETILAVDETGFLKKGNNSVGVKRQYTGSTAGKRENCQVGVFLAYASRKGAAFIDRELYLPEEWAKDGERRERAGVPEGISFATKPLLARKMLERAFGAGVRVSWVVADSVYGDARGHIGMFLEEGEQPFVLAVSGNSHVWAGFCQPKAGEVLDALREGRLPPLDESEESWERLSAGEGSKGPRPYDWIRLSLNPPMQEGFSRWLLVRRQIDDPGELTAYVAFAPEEITLEELAKVAGSRWKIEEAFEEAKGEVGLDHYEVRGWVGWYRHITLAMFAHAFLCAIRASGHEVEPSQKGAAARRESKTGSSLRDFKKRRGL